MAVSLQVKWVINLAVGCHYFPWGPQLPPQPLSGLLPVCLLSKQRHIGCEQFAQDCYLTTSRQRFEPGYFSTWVQHANHSATEPPYLQILSHVFTVSPDTELKPTDFASITCRMWIRERILDGAFSHIQRPLHNPPREKVKVAHTRLPSVRFRSWSRFMAVSLQVTWVINPAVGCQYFQWGPQLPPQPLGVLLSVFLLGEQRHIGCEQFAQDCYLTTSRLRFEPGSFSAWVQHANDFGYRATVFANIEPRLHCFAGYGINTTGVCFITCLMWTRERILDGAFSRIERLPHNPPVKRGKGSL